MQPSCRCVLRFQSDNSDLHPFIPFTSGFVCVRGSKSVFQESQKFFEETSQQKDMELQSLKDMVRAQDASTSEKGAKDQQLSEKDATIKTLTEQWKMTSEQMRIMQENFATMEERWRQEKSQLQVLFVLVFHFVWLN